MISDRRCDSSNKICLQIMPYHLYMIVNYMAIVKIMAWMISGALADVALREKTADLIMV